MDKPAVIITKPDGTEEVLYEPTPKGIEYHLRTEPNVLAFGGRGSGKSYLGRWDCHMRALAHPGFRYCILRRTYPELQKALALNTVVPTPGGFSTIGELKVGDSVIAPDGTATLVVHKSRQQVDPHGTFEITFDDGEKIIASAGHKWYTQTHAERSAQNRIARGLQKMSRRPLGAIRTTEEIYKSLKVEHGKRSNHSIQLAKAWDLPAQKLSIDPYVLGVWLGDGTSGQGAITTNDLDIVKEIENAGYKVNKRSSRKYEYGIEGLQAQLKDLGVLHHKHVPEIYLRSSCEQRLALLQGLMDTDGCIRKGYSCFCNTNERKCLSEAVFILASSLGLKPIWNECPAKLNGKDCGTSYNVGWSSNLNVFRLQRKLQRLVRVRRKSQSNRYIISCNRVADQVCQCIMVEHSSHQFLVGRASIPTHNSHLIHIPGEMKKLGGYFHHTEKTAYYPNGSMGMFSHCSTDADVLNLLSVEFHLMFFDELSTFSWEMFTKLSASVRVPKDSNLIAMVRAATNPLGPSAEELDHYFVSKDIDPATNPDYNPNDWHSIKINLVDNPHLDADQYRKRFASLPEHVRKAWIDGDFALENALFDFRPTKTVRATQACEDGTTIETLREIPYHVIPSLDIPELVKHAQIYRAIDVGWFPDPTYVLWIAHLGNRLICFHEETRYKTIAKDMAEIIKETDKALGVTRVVATYCDPSMDVNTTADIHTIKDIFETNGIPLECSINNRELFAASIHSALNQESGLDTPKLQIYEAGCPYLIKSLPRQRYDTKNPLRLADQADDHPVVTLAYFLISSGALDRTAIPTAKEKPWMKPKREAGWTLGQYNIKTP